MVDNGLFLTKEQAFYNGRTKYYIDSSGQRVPYEIMVCNRPVFSSGLEVSDFTKAVEWRLEYQAANEELFGDKHVSSRGYKSAPATKQELLDSSRRRAKRKIFDYCICNEFDMFITLTLDKELIDRDDYGAVIKKLNSFLGNRVRRHGLKYIGVPEYHKNGGLHFHFAVSGGGFKLVDSGCVSVEGHKKPIRNTTADKLHVPHEQRHTVYNITDWRLGFSTAIKTYGSRGALATYLSKELCKPVQKQLVNSGAIDKIGGRWYLHGGDLRKPVVVYHNQDFNAGGESYSLSTDGGDFKVYKLDENGVVLR